MFVGLFLAALSAAPPAPPPETTERIRLLVESMKTNPRGPYRGVLWYCADGSQQAPKEGACAQRGGGRQHGVPSEDALALARFGIHVGTVLAALEPAALTADDGYRARALVVERYLERARDGWVMRRARSYRGARQAEDEELAAVRLLQDVAGRPEWAVQRRSLVLRLIRALPYGPRDARVDELRGLASRIGDLDPGFQALRAKIHSAPSPEDAAAVTAYARRAPEATRALAQTLQAELQTYYTPGRWKDNLRSVLERVQDRPTRAAAKAFLAAEAPDAVLLTGRDLLLALDATFGKGRSDRVASRNLLLLYAMTLVEERMLGTTAPLAAQAYARGRVLDLTRAILDSLPVLGLASGSELPAVAEVHVLLSSGAAASQAEGTARALRLLEWVRARHVADFGLALARYQVAEPEVGALLDDLMRSSVLLPLATLLDRLNRDVERLRGGGHLIRGLEGRWTVRGENPGLARGTLRILGPDQPASGLRRDEIAVLPELAHDLPPVAGIITLGPAGSLSHVSLLAQNLAIPHIALVGDARTALASLEGRTAILGVSAGRRVIFGPVEAFEDLQADLPSERAAEPSGAPELEVDAQRLDLTATALRSLRVVSPDEAGVRVGPKAAELARLTALFPDRVSPAVAIPFGAFVRHVSQRPPGGGPAPLEALRAAYELAARRPADDAEAMMLPELARFRAAIDTLPFPDGFTAEVEAALATLGPEGTFGVFVRSDTNVEDLKTFTGAGLNLTLPNRVGLPSVLRAIREVWASPFTERSYRWRQRLIRNPEHVYPSVILHKTVPSEVSGVAVTTDLETGDLDALTLSFSEGVAAVVDGGSAETRVVGGRAPRLLAPSRVFSQKRIPPPPQEGVTVQAASGKDPLLGPAELTEVERLVREVKAAMPRGDVGAAWDIELGLVAGRAYLFQVRPLKASRRPATHPLLVRMDKSSPLPDGPLDPQEILPP
jgi:hypothetical protein